MRLVHAFLGIALATALLAPAASAWPPVCMEKGAMVLRTSVSVMFNCGVSVTVTHCPPVGEGPCWAVTTEQLLP